MFLKYYLTFCQNKNLPQWFRILFVRFLPLNKVLAHLSKTTQWRSCLLSLLQLPKSRPPRRWWQCDMGVTFKWSKIMLVFPKRLNIILSDEENRGGRPVPGSLSFVRANQMYTSTAQVQKLPSGDYLTFYVGNLSYRANDVTLKTAIENRFPIKVDQAVVAYSSNGRSRGCAFVTVRWSTSIRIRIQTRIV